jgi:hypothetical protein
MKKKKSIFKRVHDELVDWYSVTWLCRALNFSGKRWVKKCIEEELCLCCGGTTNTTSPHYGKIHECSCLPCDGGPYPCIGYCDDLTKCMCYLSK